MARSVNGSTHYCHICGLPIPDQIGSPNHPLFGTVDHVIPFAKGGKNRLENRKAAHRKCNTTKGDLHLYEVDRVALQSMVRALLGKVGTIVTRKILARAKTRIAA